MSDKPTRLYIAFEPEHRLVAERLDDWRRANEDLDRYVAVKGFSFDDPAAEPARGQLRPQIGDADVLVCIVGQTTFLDPWVDWEIRTALDRPMRRGSVAIMLNDLYGHPPALTNAGTMFIPLRQTYVMDAIAWAADQMNPTEDFVLEE